MKVIEEIKKVSKNLGNVRIMEVCGGHTNTIMKYGIRNVLPKNIKLISGPGCPVCVTSQRDIDEAVELALNGVKLAVYGDMLRVPGTKMSLSDAKAKGSDIQTLYSTDQIKDDRVFFAVGFETTTPMTADLLARNVSVLSSHKIMPPAMLALTDKMNIDGFIDPGHVSVIIGSDKWKKLNIPRPQVITGFAPEQILNSVLTILKQIRDKKCEVVNEYPEVVKPEGNLIARKLIREHMKMADTEWRGLGTIPMSGLIPRNKKLDARITYKDIIKDIVSKEFPGCKCPEVIKGMKEPKECPLFAKVCTPDSPKGACMVSDSEGACAIAYKYGKSLSE